MDIKKPIIETREYKQKQDVSLYQDVCHIIEQGRERAYNAVSQQMVETYWNIGRRIVEEEQQGKERAEYGEQIIEKLSKQLTLRYGEGLAKDIWHILDNSISPLIINRFCKHVCKI